jgi:DNA-binding NarL/FixJ family response regulator
MATASLRSERMSSSATTGRRIVIVDDDDNVRTTLCSSLGEYGFDVVGTGSDGFEAVLLAVELNPEVMLLDVRMPRLGGLEAARRIRALDASIRFVILSAYDDSTLQQEARDLGASRFLVKGCSFTDLVEAIAER